MKSVIYQSPVCQLKEFNNLFIELTAKNCNMKCKHCYIDFPLSRHVKDFIPIDKVKDALIDTKGENLVCIYLTGAEPMTHPDFNSILRLCLKRTNVCICTNGSFINEKKARFLKRVEDESNYQIYFKFSLDHYDEVKNDDVRGRGAYRLCVHAINYLAKYDFHQIICCTNYYNLSKDELKLKFAEIFTDKSFQVTDENLQINTWYDKNIECDVQNWDWQSLDCEYGRILTSNGIYTCPFLANDHRGRSGSDFKDFSRKNALETSYCSTCVKNKKAMFGI